MADPVTDIQSYEVRCPQCNVSFPPETKTCIHCGARLGRGLMPRPHRIEEHDHRAGLDPSATPFDYDVDEEDLDEGRSSSPLRMLGSLVWVVLFIAFALVRACGEK